MIQVKFNTSYPRNHLINKLIQLLTEAGFANVKCYVTTWEETFDVVSGASVVQLYYFLELEGTILDGRRKMSQAPAFENIITALGDITAPSGEMYTFVTDTSVIRGNLAPMKYLFPIVIDGTLVQQDYHSMEVVIRTSVIESYAAIETDYDSFEVKVIATEEAFTHTG